VQPVLCVWGRAWAAQPRASDGQMARLQPAKTEAAARTCCRPARASVRPPCTHLFRDVGGEGGGRWGAWDHAPHNHHRFIKQPPSHTYVLFPNRTPKRNRAKTHPTPANAPPTQTHPKPNPKVITDPTTGRSKGYGFVRFASEPERDRALEMQGFNLSGRPIRVSLATARRAAGGGGAAAALANAAPHPADLDPTNTTLFIGGLGGGVTEEQLRAVFAQYGDIVYTKVPAGKGAMLRRRLGSSRGRRVGRCGVCPRSACAFVAASCVHITTSEGRAAASVITTAPTTPTRLRHTRLRICAVRPAPIGRDGPGRPKRTGAGRRRHPHQLGALHEPRRGGGGGRRGQGCGRARVWRGRRRRAAGGRVRHADGGRRVWGCGDAGE
jgi:hypothetical protein